MKMIKKALFTLFCLLVILSFYFFQPFYNACAEEFQIDSFFYPRRWDNNVTKGHLEALVVRVGFKDFPVADDNPSYRKYSDDYTI